MRSDSRHAQLLCVLAFTTHKLLCGLTLATQHDCVFWHTPRAIILRSGPRRAQLLYILALATHECVLALATRIHCAFRPSPRSMFVPSGSRHAQLLCILALATQLLCGMVFATHNYCAFWLIPRAIILCFGPEPFWLKLGLCSLVDFPKQPLGHSGKRTSSPPRSPHRVPRLHLSPQSAHLASTCPARSTRILALTWPRLRGVQRSLSTMTFRHPLTALYYNDLSAPAVCIV